MARALIAAFVDAGLPLGKTLTEMLEDHPVHCTERRGCGFTQATRLLAGRVNQPRDPIDAADLTVFAGWPQAATERVARHLAGNGWRHGWRRLDRAPAALRQALADDPAMARLERLAACLAVVRARTGDVGSRLLLDLLGDVLVGGEHRLPAVPAMPEKPEIGSCSQAEEFFLEIAHGRVRRGGRVNIVTDAHGEPVMVEKMQLGESHSAIVVSPIQINEVRIPPGGLCALRYVDETFQGPSTPFGMAVPLDRIGQARFLRLTTLTVAPEHRRDLFAHQVQAQVASQMFSPATTTIEQLQQFALGQLRGIGR